MSCWQYKDCTRILKEFTQIKEIYARFERLVKWFVGQRLFCGDDTLKCLWLRVLLGGTVFEVYRFANHGPTQQPGPQLHLKPAI